MSFYEQSSTERINGNTSTTTRKAVFQTILKEIIVEENRKKTESRLAERANKIGRSSPRISNLIIQGSSDRIQAVPYDSNKYENIQDQEAYKEGFYEHGTREILGKLEELKKEQLELIGKNDYISEVDPNTLPQDIKNNDAYVQGYIMASIIGDSKPRGKR